MVHDVLAATASLSLQERSETRLPEVMICRKRLGDAQLTHEDKAHAVRERPLLVTMTAEKRARGKKPIRAGPLYTKSVALFDGLEEIGRCRVTVSDEENRCGLIDDIIGGEKFPSLLPKLLLQCDGAGMMRIAGIPQREEAGSIDEDVSGGHK